MKLDHDLDKIYFISSNKDDEFYDSIDVIDERRSSNFRKTGAAGSGASGFCRSSTVIYSEYCSGSSITDTPEASVSGIGSCSSSIVATKAITGDCVKSDKSDQPGGVRRGDDDIYTAHEANQEESVLDCRRSAVDVDVGIEESVSIVEADGGHQSRRHSSSSEEHDGGCATPQTTIVVRADIEVCGKDGNGRLGNDADRDDGG